MRRFVADPHIRPLVILIVIVLGFIALDGSAGRFLSFATAYGTFETFATIGPVALGLGLTMIMREFDLSVAGIFGMAGCIAVMTGVQHPWLGLLLAALAGLAAGGTQGFIIHRLRLGSVGVTLGGLLISTGVAYLLTKSTSIGYDNIDVAISMSTRHFDLFSIRSLVALGMFMVAGLVVGLTRIGRDMIAAGSDRHAAIFAGVDVRALLIGVFAVSGASAALAGALLSYSLASASPAGLSDVLVPAATAAIIGGVSLSGGTGRPFGIACGVLILAVLRSGFNSIGADPWVSQVSTALILLVVAALDAPVLIRRLRRWKFENPTRSAT